VPAIKYQLKNGRSQMQMRTHCPKKREKTKDLRHKLDKKSKDLRHKLDSAAATAAFLRAVHLRDFSACRTYVNGKRLTQFMAADKLY